MNNSVNIAIATKNANKIKGIKDALSFYFKNINIDCFNVVSGVPDQPFDDEIKIGAKNRIENLKKFCKKNSNTNYDLYISVESGIIKILDDYYNISYAIVDNNEIISTGISSAFPIPNQYINDIKVLSLSSFMDYNFSEEINEFGKSGAISLLTKNVIDRIELTKESIIMALTKILNIKWQ